MSSSTIPGPTVPTSTAPTSTGTSASPGAWWAHTSRNQRRTAIGAVGLALGLGILSSLVWMSPNAPLNPARVITSEARHTVLENHLAEQNRQLTAQLDLAKQQLADTKATLASTTASAATTQSALNRVSGQMAAKKKAHAAVVAKAARAAKAATAAAATTSAAHVSTASTAAAKPAVVTAPAKSALVSPKSKLFGLYTVQAPYNYATYDDLTTKIGEQPNVVGYFGGWDQSFRADAVQKAWARREMPILTWESQPAKAGNDESSAPAYSLPNILAGNFDTYLHTYAKAIVKNGLPLGIRFDHEMNGDWYPWAESDKNGNSINGNRPGDYVKVWHYVHDIFAAEGANKYVVWIWSPNIVNRLPASLQSPEHTQSLYPGDAYVDWVGMSAYLRPPYAADNTYSFDYTFGPTLTQLRALTSKRILLSEIGASDVGGHKPAWVTSLFQGLAKPANADILGFSWFDLAITSYTSGQLATNDWRIDSRPDVLAAFTTGISAPGNGFLLRKVPS